MTPPLFICFFNQLFTGIVGCGLTSRGNGADFGILRMDFIKSCFVKTSVKLPNNQLDGRNERTKEL